MQAKDDNGAKVRQFEGNGYIMFLTGALPAGSVASVENSTITSTWHRSEGAQFTNLERFRARKGRRLPQKVFDYDPPSPSLRRRAATKARNRKCRHCSLKPQIVRRSFQSVVSSGAAAGALLRFGKSELECVVLILFVQRRMAR